jgi:hypothetical protein
MTEKKIVIYNGVEMDSEWPIQLEEAQEITFLKIDGEKFNRIKWGSERELGFTPQSPCGDCGTAIGKYHVPFMCDIEECPSCKGQLFSCDCEFDD